MRTLSYFRNEIVCTKQHRYGVTSTDTVSSNEKGKVLGGRFRRITIWYNTLRFPRVPTSMTDMLGTSDTLELISTPCPANKRGRALAHSSGEGLPA